MNTPIINNKIILASCIILILLFANSPLSGQQVIFDQGIRAGEITAFPVINKPNEYYYLSDNIILSKHANGQPQFSFIKYAKNTDNSSGNTSFSESNKAGGVLHALVELSVSDEVKSDAERELRKINSNAKLMGPIIYKSGRIIIISSIIGEEGELTRKVVGIGAAPILEGQKAAVSVLLTKEGADILWATFQTPTPDLSFQFEMEASGYLSPKSVKIEADFEQIYKHTSFEAAVVTPVLAAEIKTAFDELSNSGAIKVEQIGTDEDLNKLKETAYTQLVNLMFDKVGGQSVTNLNAIAPNNQKSMLDRATEMLGKARTEARDENKRIRREGRERADRIRNARERSRTAMDSIYRSRGVTYDAVSQPPENLEEPDVNEVPIPGIAIAASFQMKRIKRTGKYFIDLNKYTEDVKSFPFAENIGGFIVGCSSCFNRINIDEPLYKQRDIQASLMDISSDDFGPYISNVEILLQKKHQNGEVTNANAIISKKTFNEQANFFTMQYGWKGDDDRAKWLKYKYKTRWTFSGGHTIEKDWEEQEFGTIPLAAPLVKRDIYIELDPTFVQENNIRAAEIKLFYKIGDRTSQVLIKLKTSTNELSKSAQIILPVGTDAYEYEAVLFVRGSNPVKIERTATDYGSIYIDKL